MWGISRGIAVLNVSERGWLRVGEPMGEKVAGDFATSDVFLKK